MMIPTRNEKKKLGKCIAHIGIPKLNNIGKRKAKDFPHTVMHKI